VILDRYLEPFGFDASEYRLHLLLRHSHRCHHSGSLGFSLADARAGNSSGSKAQRNTGRAPTNEIAISRTTESQVFVGSRDIRLQLNGLLQSGGEPLQVVERCVPLSESII
jgi:hypothetical protein